MQGAAKNSFNAAASVSQYTGDLPQAIDPEEVQMATQNLTPDQAIQLAESLQSKMEAQDI